MKESESNVLMVARTQVGKLFPGLSPKTLANLCSDGKGPKCFKRGRLVFYRVTDVETWLMQNPIQTEGK